MNKLFTFLIILLVSGYSWGQCGPFQVYESFGTAALPTQGGTWVGTSMTYNTSSISRTGTYALTFDAANDAIRTPQIAAPGVFSFWYKRSTNTTAWSCAIETSPDNSTWTPRGTISSITTTYQQYSIDLGALGLTNVYVRVRDTRASGTAARYLDDMSWTSTTASSNTILIQGTSCSASLTCGTTYTLYDRGGVNDKYNNSMTTAPLVISSASVGGIVTVNFTTLGTESGYDYLKLYNGNSTSATALHSGSGWSGTTAPGSFTSTDGTGALTVDFTSDSGVDDIGFVATVTCNASPKDILFYQTGSSSQLAFNNAYINDNTPTFRASATHTASFDRFQVEINTNSTYTGTAYTQTFSGTYASGTQYDLECNSLSTALPTTDGVTYYVRIRASDDGGSIYGPWSSGTYSFTYKSSGDPDWYQTTAAQLSTNTLNNTSVNSGNYIEKNPNYTNNGNHNIESSTFGYDSGAHVFIKVTMAQNFILEYLNAYFSARWNNAGNRLIMSVYTDNSNYPGTKILQTDQHFLSSTGWTSVPVLESNYEAAYSSYATSFPAGTYWIGYMTNNSGNVMRYTTTGSNARWRNSGTFGTFESPVPGTFSSTGNYSLSMTTYPVGVNAITPPVQFASFEGASAFDDVIFSSSGSGTVSVGVYADAAATTQIIAPTSSSPIDISGINTTTYPSIYLKATLSGASPSLDNWKVTGLYCSAPAVTTTAATTLATTSADFNGNITSNGGCTLTERGFCYKTTAGVAITDNKTAATGTATGTYSKSFTGLSVNTRYYYKSYATNSTGTTLSSTEIDFWTLANVPSAPTVNDSTTSSVAVTVNANGNPSTTEFAIQETTSGNYVQSDGSLSASAVWQTASVWDTKTVTGLTANTTYTFQVQARNGANTETVFSSSASLTTLANVPDAPTVNNPTSSFLDVIVNPNSNPSTTEFAIQETTSGNYVQTNGSLGASAVWQTAAVWDTKTVTGLSVNTSYSFRVIARNGDNTETAFSGSTSLRTLAYTPGTPTVDNESNSSMVVTIDENSNPASVEYAIMETTTNSYVQTDGTLDASAVWQTESNWGTKTVTGLSANVSYTFKVKARNSSSVETNFSSTASLATLANVPSAPTVNNPNTTTLDVFVNVNSNSSSTEFAIFETSTNNYVQSDGSLSASVAWLTAASWGTKTVTGLTINTEYTFEVKARNSANIETAFGSTTSLYTSSSASPNIIVGSLTEFSNQTINTTSSEKSYTISGTDLTDDITITPPVGFEISTTSGSGFVANPNTITLNESGGTVNSTTIYVIFKPTALSAYSDNISHTSSGATSRNVAVSGTVVSPANPASFSATAHSSTQINLSATANANSNNIVVVYNATGTFTAPTDEVAPGNVSDAFAGGTILYKGSAASLTNHTGLSPIQTVYYKVFSYDAYNFYSAGLTDDETTNTPVITVGSVTAFDNQTVNTTSSEKSYTISATDLVSDITLTPPVGFEISKTSGSGFVANPSTLTVAQSGGTVGSTTIYVRFKPTTVTSYSDNITHTSTSATTKNVAVSGTGIAPNDPTGVSATTISESQINVSFTPNGSNNVLIAYNTTNSFGTPSNETAYSAGNSLPTAGTVAYVGNVSDFNHTSLASNTILYYKVWTVDGSNYYSSGVAPVNATTRANLSATTTASSITASGFSTGGTVSAGGGATLTARGIAMGTSSPATSLNAEGGTSTGVFTQSITSLNAQTQYYYRAYATNAGGTSYGPEYSLYTLSNEPTAHPAAFTASAISSSQIDLSFSAASTITNAYGYLILQRQGANPTGTPTDATAYSVGNTIGDATVAAIITSAAATSTSITSLLGNTLYNYSIIPYSYDGSNNATINYYTAATIKTANATTLCGGISNFPWSEGFETTSIPNFPTCWLYQNADIYAFTANNSQSSYDADARTGSLFMKITPTTTPQYVWTPGFQVTAGNTYTLSFWWAGDNRTGWTGNVVYNTSQSSTGAVNTQLSNPTIVSSGTQTSNFTYSTQFITDFVAPFTGIYFFAINVSGSGNAYWSLSFDDFSFAEVVNYYSKSSGNLNELSNWGTNTDGSGTTPSNFTDPAQIFNIRNNETPTIGAAWTVSGSGSKIVVGDGTNACNFTIPSSFACSGTIDVANAATLTIQHTTIPTIGTLASGSTVNYNGATQTLRATTYHHLILSGSGAKTFPSGTTTINGILSIENGTSANTFTGSIAYGSSATLQYNAGSSNRTVSTEWPASFTATGGVIIKGTGIITLNGAKTLGNSTNVPLNINSGATLTPGANLITLHGDFINAGTLTSGSGGVTIAGTVTTQSIAGFTTTGTVSMTKTGGTATFAGNVNGAGFTINGNGGTLNLGSGLTHTFTGTWTRTNGTVNGGSSTLRLGSGFSGTGGTFTANTGTVEWYASATQTIAAVIYNNLILSGTSAKTMTSVSTINGNFTINGSATATPTTSLTVSGTTTLNGTSQHTLGAANILSSSGVIILNGGSFRTGATVGYAQTLSTLTLTENSTLALGTGSHTLTFTSSAPAWTGGKTLTITGWTGTGGSAGGASATTGKIQVGVGNLSAGQLAQISFSGYPAGATITPSGELVPSSGATGGTFYSKSSSAPETESNWNTATDGSGMDAVSGDFTRGNTFVVQNGHTMTTAATWSISGTGSKLQIANGGILESPFAITVAAATTFQIDNGGTYKHQNTGAWATTIFTGTESFGNSSTIEINATNTNFPTNSTYGNLIINFTADPTVAMSFGGNLTTINGNLSILNTQGREVRLAANTSPSITIAGNLSISGSTSTFVITSGTGNPSVTVNGDFIMDSGTFSLSGGSGTGTLNVKRNFTHTGGTITETSSGSGVISINGNTSQTIESTGQSNSITFTVAPTGSGTVEVATGKTFVNGGATTFNVSNTSSATEFTVNGTFTRTSSAGATATGSMVVSATGTYISNYSGASIPTATWDAASLLQIDASLADGEFTESFGNVTFNNAASCLMHSASSLFSQTIQGNLTINSSGSVVVKNNSYAATLTINGNLNIIGTGSLDINSSNSTSSLTRTIIVNGNYSQSDGTMNLSSNTSSSITSNTAKAILEVKGDFSHMGGVLTETAVDNDYITQIVLSGTSSNSFVSSGQTGRIEVIINKTASSPNNTLSLSDNSNIDYNLTLTSGLFTLDSYNLTLGATATITGTPNATKMIVATSSGQLRKTYTTTGSFTFPVGDNDGTAEYSPVTVNVTGGSGFSSAYVGVNLADAKHPNNNSTTNFLSRYWNVNQSGITNCVATVSGTYLNTASDVAGTLGDIKAAQLDGTFNQTSNPWKKTGGSVLSGTTLTYTNATITAGQTSVFTGITSADPSINITGGDVTVCKVADVTLTANASGDATINYAWSGLITGSTSSSTATATTSSAGGPNSYTVTVTDGNGITNAATAVTITINETPTSGVVATAQTICHGDTPALLTSSDNGTGTGTIAYEWQTNASGSYVTIDSETGSTYAPPALNATTSYQRRTVATSGGTSCYSSYTTPIQITVNDIPTSGSITSAQTICSGSAPNELTSFANGTGTGTIEYEWQTNASGSYVTIGGETENTYTPPALTATTSYQRRTAATSGGATCYSTYTTPIQITVNNAPTAPTSIGGTISICGGAQTTIFAVGGSLGDGAIYQWGTGSVVGDNIIADSVSSSLLTAALNANTTYWVRRVGNTACVNNTSGVTQLISVNLPTNVTGLTTGDYVWAGYSSNNWNNVENWLVYDSEANPVYSVASTVPSLSDKVFILDDDIACGFSSTASVLTTSASCQELTIDAGRTLTLADGETLSVSGDWKNNGNFVSGTGTVVFNGTAQQSIDAGSSNFANVTINNSAGVVLSSDLTVEGALTMTLGNINANGNILEIGTDVTNIGSITHTSGLVLGKVKRWFAESTNSGSSGVFPVGVGANYRPFMVEFIEVPTGGGNLTVQFKQIAMGWQNFNNSPTIPELDGCEEFLVKSYCEEGYWEVVPTGAGMSTAQYDVTLTATGITGVNTLCKITAMKRVGTGLWQESGTHVAPSGSTNIPIVKRSGAVGWSNWGVAGGGDNELPVELLDFTLKCNNNIVSLQWQTASEINNDFFILEKSYNGIDFEELTRIQGAGNSNAISTYQYTDKQDENKLKYYRLSQVDFDGTKVELGIRVANCSAVDNIQYSIYPNPFKEEISITTSLATECKIEVMNYSGHTVYSEIKAIEKELVLDLEHLKPGLYMLRVTDLNGHGQQVFKLIKN